MSGWQRVMTQLVSERGSALTAYGFLLCGRDAEAADLVQEALVRVFARPRTGWAVQEAEAYVRRAMLKPFHRPSPSVDALVSGAAPAAAR